MSSRREFLTQAVAAGSAAVLGATRLGALATPAVAAKPLRVLILGGTGFIGPHHVRAAVARGHQVAVFNRGKGEADLPATVERLVGDRNGNLEAILHRDWDAVVDLATYVPGWVRSLGEALKERVKHYTFISTVAVYDTPAATEQTTEQSPVLAYTGSADPYALTARPGDQYGALKVLCEREAERQFPGRTLILRPGHIVGPGDWNGFFTYWPARMAHGGDMLAAGEPSMPVQVIDIRDMADWAIRLIEHGATGIYNTVGPAVPTMLGQLVHAARRVAVTAPPLTAPAVTSPAVTSPAVTWVPSAWLAAQPDRERWRNVLFWSVEAEGFARWMRMSSARARAQGLTTRPLSVTLADTFAWYQQQPAARQAELLWPGKPKAAGTGSDVVPTPWSSYLKREQELLAAWRAQQKQQR